MEACWSFKSLVGSSCGFDAKDRKCQNQIVPLVSCSKDISGPQNEIDLILCRARLFYKTEESIKSMTVYPRYRAILVISWARGGGTRCRVPQAISGHGRSRATWPKGDRSLGKKDSSLIMNNSDEEGGEEAKPHEEYLDDLSRNIINKSGLFHPIMFNSHNLCELASGPKLSKFPTSMLQDICNVYELDSSLLNGKRKKPYIDI